MKLYICLYICVTVSGLRINLRKCFVFQKSYNHVCADPGPLSPCNLTVLQSCLQETSQKTCTAMETSISCLKRVDLDSKCILNVISNSIPLFEESGFR